MLQRQKSRLTPRVNSNLLAFTLCLFMELYLVSSPHFVILRSAVVPPLQPLGPSLCSLFSHKCLSETKGGPKPHYKWYYNGFLVVISDKVFL